MTTIYRIDISTSPTPVLSTERAQVLDVLRGIAIFGILINNIYGFSGYGFLTDEMKQQFATFPIDDIVNFFQVALVEGKFYSLFSLLFGIGFSIILIRGKQKGRNSLKIFYRRLLVLLLIGAMHLYFFWEGDILFLYAVLGLLLPLFRNLTDRTLLKWAVVLVLSPIAIDLVKLWLQVSPGQFLRPIGEPIDVKNNITDDNWRTFLFDDKDGWKNWRAWQESAWAHRFHDLLDSNRLPKVLGVFLLGFYTGRKMIYANLEQYKPLLKKVMFWGFVVGLPCSLAMAYFDGDDKYIPASGWGMLDTIFYSLGVVPLALAYASSISLLWLKAKSRTRLNVFAPVGKMALTNYLVQTVIGTLVFYGAGFNLGQKFGLVILFPIVVIIYSIQIIYSSIWLRYFEYGPVEWVWRQLTYGKTLPLKKRKELHLSDKIQKQHPVSVEESSTLL